MEMCRLQSGPPCSQVFQDFPYEKELSGKLLLQIYNIPEVAVHYM